MKLKKFIKWIRFGKIKSRIVDSIDYTPVEIEYFGRGNKLIGYWAYGHFDYCLPYKGE